MSTLYVTGGFTKQSLGSMNQLGQLLRQRVRNDSGVVGRRQAGIVRDLASVHVLIGRRAALRSSHI